MGIARFDVGGANREAFDLAPDDSTEMTVLDILLAASALSRNGVLYDEDGSGTIEYWEKLLRTMAFDVFAAINENKA